MSRQPDEPREGSAGQEPTDDEVDRRFAELTAGLADAVGIDVPSDEAPSPGDVGSAGLTAPDEERAGPGDGLGGPRDYSLAEEPDEGFEPPEPEPLGSAEPVMVLAWLGAAGGPLVFLLLVLLWPSAPSAAWWATLVATLAGWGVVVWRLPRHRDGDDDGAVV